jgi:hypothetical protein
MTHSTAATDESSPTLRCARHPGTETVLRCGKCDTPICPRCLVPTPVGARCPTCAQVRRLSSILKPIDLTRAISFGIGTAAVGAILVNLLGFIQFLGLFGYAILGFLVGEAVSLGANRKRARELAPIAVACLFVGYMIGFALLLGFTTQSFSLALLMAPALALRNGTVILGLLIGALLAWMRAR